jgi:acetyl-CoA carboxylase carboxyl transferase subunit beta
MGWDALKKFVFHRQGEVPDGVWMKCDGCNNLVKKNDVAERFRTCPDCNYHFSLTSEERVALLFDSFEEYWADMAPMDPLNFRATAAYKEKTLEAQKATGLNDAAVTGKGVMDDMEVMFGVTDSRFMMGSMGSVVGEKIARLTEKAMEQKLPLIIVSGSGGGARMYEGCISLMQMAKTSAALARFRDAGGLYISILTNPTMAGVMASFASLGDLIIAEPKALIGFTGPRVIQQTIAQELPPGFQTSEFLLEHGLLDMIISRPQMRSEIIRILKYSN